MVLDILPQILGATSGNNGFSEILKSCQGTITE